MSEPVAIIGMACRFPGAPDLGAYWELLIEGKNTVSKSSPGSGVLRVDDVSEERDGLSAHSLFGGFIDEIDLFDPAFFRMSPLEAEAVDPQQRLVLETAWRALEDAGLDPDRLKGTRTGVYTGVGNLEYRQLVYSALEQSLETADPAVALYAGLGTSLNGIGGRLAFMLGLEGPVMSVDTACSSSLVAAHEAVTALQHGEADLSIAAGVNVILDSRRSRLYATAGVLSPDGQCKAFDESANGLVRGEGCGVVVFKRLSDAVADGDRVWSVIRGSAVNHDGASTAYMAPNERALRTVYRDALARSGVAPAAVDYVEAHGTGTPVGDPIELSAVAAVYGEGREPERPLLIGSAKTNIGHLETAAGIAGLIKTALSIHHGVIPRQLHLESPTSAVDWERLPVRVTGEATAWPHHLERPPLAAVSSYGMSGTNAHMVVEGHDDNRSPRAEDGFLRAGPRLRATAALTDPFAGLETAVGSLSTRPARILPLSAKSGVALRDLARGYLSWLERLPSADDTPLADMAWSAGTGRSQFNCRAALRFSDAESLSSQLEALAGADEDVMPVATRKVAFAYTGQGRQWAGMGLDLYETEPVARAVFDRCEEVFAAECGSSLLDVMFGRNRAGSELRQTQWAQPALYALDCALTALWSSVGVRPSVVCGHSFGELPAAQAAGVFSLEDGMRLAIARGQLISETAPGAGAAIFAPRAEVEAVIEQMSAASEHGALGIGSDNGLNQVVTGFVDQVDAISAHFEERQVRVRRMNFDQAAHSPLMAPILTKLEAFGNSIAVSPPKVDFVSNISGNVIGAATELNGSYWRRHVHEPVAFAAGVATLAGLGVDTVIEIGPGAVLGPMISMIWPQPPGTPGAVVVIPSMERPPEQGETQAASDFTDAVAEAYAAGVDISFNGLFVGENRSRVAIPGYPFQRRRCWFDPPRQRRHAVGHPLLGLRRESPHGGVSFETEIAPGEPSWLAEHRAFGRVLAPGAMYGAMAASALMSEGATASVGEMQLYSPLIFPIETDDVEATRRMQLVLGPVDGQKPRSIEIFSKGAEANWTLHAKGSIAATSPGDGGSIDIGDQTANMAPGDMRSLYEAKRDAGVELGASFRGLISLWHGTGEAIGEIVLPSQVERNGIDVHPLLLDACFQVVLGALGVRDDDLTVYMPFGWERLRLNGPLPERLTCRAALSAASIEAVAADEPAEVLKCDLGIYDTEGAAIGAVEGFTIKRATRAALLASLETVEDLMYEVVWRERPRGETAPSSSSPETGELASDSPGVWVLAADRGGTADGLAAALARRDQTVLLVGDDEGEPPPVVHAGVFNVSADANCRQSWRSVIERLPQGAPLRGVVHLLGVDGHGSEAKTEQIKQDVTRVLRSALALVQGLFDADASPEHGLWFISRGAQILNQEQNGELAGATLWGFAKVVARELAQLPTRVVDLDPDEADAGGALIDELLDPGTEDLIAYRAGHRNVQRLVRGRSGTHQLELPDAASWQLSRNAEGKLSIATVEQRALRPGEIRVAVEAAAPHALSAPYWEMCGRVVETGGGVRGLEPSDRVAGIADGALGPTAVTAADIVALAPAGTPAGTVITALLDGGEASVAELVESDRSRVPETLADLVQQSAASGWGPNRPVRWALSEAAAASLAGPAQAPTRRAFIAPSPVATGQLRGDRTYLVTGGLGGVGGATAEWLADRGAQTIVLNGRRPPDAAADQVIRSLRERGVRVLVELADVAVATELRAMLDRVDAACPPLGGVVHSVAALSDAAVINQTWDAFEEVLWSKVLGAWELHRQTENQDLDLFILYTSMSGVRGNPGQANYAAANAFVDQVALHRRARGLPGQAIQWGGWGGIGGAERRRSQLEKVVAASGYDWMTPTQGIRGLDRLVRQDLGVGGVTLIDWDVYADSLRSVPPLIEELLTARAKTDADGPDAAAELVSRLRETPEPERLGMIEQFLAGLLQDMLRLPSPPDPALAFFDLGLDSLTALELRARLNAALGGKHTVSNTAVFDHPDTASLAAHLAELIEASDEQAPRPEVPVSAPRQPRRDAADGIAIVGMACKFPGAEDLSAFWELLEAGASALSNARDGSGNWEGFFGDSDGPQRRAGFVKGLDLFDASFFRILAIEARNMDPQLRMLLETTWHALEDAGINPDTLKGSRTGTYIGIATNEYQDVMNLRGKPISYMGINGAVSIGRVAFTLGLEGPALPVQATCASSLAAVHHAATALRHGEINLALVGGVHAALSPETTLRMADLGMLSSTGECKAFSSEADGFVRAEGCGVVVLRRLSEALDSGQRIWSVIRGSGVNQSGMSAGPAIPSGTAQQQVIEQALSNANIDPSHVDYLEAHGTATELGDAIELEAAAAVYRQGRDAKRPLLVGSVKSNIGHAESAAGIAGLIKTVLSMYRGIIPAHLHSRAPSEHVDWERLQVQLASETTEWPDHADRERLAAVGAYGMSGANAHVVVEGIASGVAAAGPWVCGSPRLVGPGSIDQTPPPATEPSAASDTVRLLPLSAKSPEALSDLAGEYLAWLEQFDGAAPESALADAAYTAAVGRSHFEHRAGVVFSDAATLRDRLSALAASPLTESVSSGEAEAEFAIIEGSEEEPVLDGEPSEALVRSAAQSYESGSDVDFARLFWGERRRLVAIPGYPFQRRRFWQTDH